METRDLMSDTWVAVDDLGRSMPGRKETGPMKKGHKRFVGIFYVSWHSDSRHVKGAKEYKLDVTKLLKKHPEARLDAKNPNWRTATYHCAEPEMGYFLSKDEYVIRRDLSMLADAGWMCLFWM